MAVDLINLAVPIGSSGPFQSISMNENTGNGWELGFSVGTGTNGVAEDDLLLFVWSCERSSGLNPTITTNGLHPTSGRTLTLTNATNTDPSGTATDWVDFGYAVHGQQRQGSTTNTANQRGALGIFGKYVAASDVLSGGVVSFSGQFSISGLSGNNAWRLHSGLYCVRGIGSKSGTRDINALATLSRSTLFYCDMSGENYGGTNYPHGGATDECVWIGPQTTTYNSTTIYGSGVSGFDSPTVLFFGAWRNSGTDAVASPSPTRSFTGGIGTNYSFTSPMSTFSNHDNGVLAASGTTFEGGSWRNSQSHYNAYMYRKFGSFSDMNNGWNGTTSAPKAFGYGLNNPNGNNSANGPTCLAVIIPEAAPTTTHTERAYDEFSASEEQASPLTSTPKSNETAVSEGFSRSVTRNFSESAELLEDLPSRGVSKKPLDSGLSSDFQSRSVTRELPAEASILLGQDADPTIRTVLDFEEASSLSVGFERAVGKNTLDACSSISSKSFEFFVSITEVADSSELAFVGKILDFLDSAGALSSKTQNFERFIDLEEPSSVSSLSVKNTGVFQEESAGGLEEAGIDSTAIKEFGFNPESSAQDLVFKAVSRFISDSAGAEEVANVRYVLDFFELSEAVFALNKNFDRPSEEAASAAGPVLAVPEEEVLDSLASVDALGRALTRSFEDSSTLEALESKGLNVGVSESVSGVSIKSVLSEVVFSEGALTADLRLSALGKKTVESLESLSLAKYGKGLSLKEGSEALSLIKQSFLKNIEESGLALSKKTLVLDFEDSCLGFQDQISSGDILISATITGGSALEGLSPPSLFTIGEALALIDIYNIALNALGVGTLGGVNDGSPQSTLLTDVFPSFKRQFLTDYSWNGAKKTAVLSRLQDYNATDVKPVGDRWAYAYVLPDDYLRVLRINGYERYNNTQQHLENAFEIEVVNYATSATETANKRCLLTEEPTVNLEYIFEPPSSELGTLLGAQTEHALGLALAHYVARNFGKTPQEIAVLAEEARRAITAAKGVDGQEKTQRLRPDLGLIESRYWWRG